MEYVEDKPDGSKRERTYLYRHLRGTQSPPLLVLGAGHSRWTGRAACRRLRSRFFGVELVTAGQALFRQDGREYRVGPGEVFVLRKFSSHEYRVGEAGFLHKRYATFQGPVLDTLLGQLPLGTRDHLAPARPAEVARRLRSLEAAVRAEEALLASELAFGLLLELGRNQGPSFPAAIVRTLDFMRENLARNPDLAEIRAASGLGAKKFDALFRHYLKRPPMQVFHAEKMRRASMLLRTVPKSVKEIAREVGFEDPLYFSSRFKQYSGLSPRAFREREAGMGLD